MTHELWILLSILFGLTICLILWMMAFNRLLSAENDVTGQHEVKQ